MLLDRDFVRKIVPDVQFLYGSFPLQTTFSFDTRTLTDSELFVAFVGKKTDGHCFLSEAFTKGAGVLIAHDKKEHLLSIDENILRHKMVIAVSDPLRAVVDLVSAWRLRFSIPVVAVTGSVGKTTTKELVSSMLQAAGKNYLVSTGNKNTRIGCAITLSGLDSVHEGVVVEVGINRRNEMKEIVALVQPTKALITGVSPVHLAGLGSFAHIAAEKRAIFSFFKENSIGIINGDQTILARVGYQHPVIKFGLKKSNQIQARKIKIENGTITFVLKVYDRKAIVKINSFHRAHVFNALAAASLAYVLKIPFDIIVEKICSFVPCNGRFSITSLKNRKGFLIDDCYNASPLSMKEALLAFSRIPTKGQKIAVLGDMLELGSESHYWHRQLGLFLRKVSLLEQLILVGSEVAWTKKTVPLGIKTWVVPTWKEAVKKLKEILGDEPEILVKGSFGVNLGNLVSEFT